MFGCVEAENALGYFVVVSAFRLKIAALLAGRRQMFFFEIINMFGANVFLTGLFQAVNRHGLVLAFDVYSKSLVITIPSYDSV